MRRNGEGNFGRIPQPNEGRGKSLQQAGGLPIEGPELARHLRRAQFARAVGELSDVDIDTNAPELNQGLIWNGENWVPGAGGGTVLIEVRNESGTAIARNAAVYVSGEHTSGKPLVDLADASDNALMPAIGLVQDEILNNTEGYVIAAGSVEGLQLDPAVYNDGDSLYVSASTPGALTNVKPTGYSAGPPEAVDKVQKVALVTKVSSNATSNNGWAIVMGAGRVNDQNNEIVRLIGRKNEVGVFDGTSTDTSLGPSPGAPIADNSTIYDALTAITQDLGVPNDGSVTTNKLDSNNSIVVLSGVTLGNSDLGTFTGTTIADNETIKGALQDLETAVESAGGGGDPNAEIRQYAGFDYVVLDAADSSSAAGDIPLVLTPKGVGSVMLTMPDGTDSLTGTGGGNARGTRSVDLTTFRRRNFDVCSGDLNFMAGQSSRIAGGAANVVVGYRAQSEYPTAGYNVVIGSSASAGNFQYGTLSTVIGRGHYTTYADTTTIGTNNGNYHSGGPLGFNRPHSQIIVGNSCRPHQPASITINNGRWESGSNLNNSLPSRVVLRRMTTDATAAELRCQMYAGFTPGVQTQDNSINTHDMNLLALSDTGDWAQWQRRFVTKRNSGAATTTLVSTTTVGTDSGSNSGSAPAGWSFATAIDPNGVFGQAGMLITEVTGAASTNIRWIATIDTLECEYS